MKGRTIREGRGVEGRERRGKGEGKGREEEGTGREGRGGKKRGVGRGRGYGSQIWNSVHAPGHATRAFCSVVTSLPGQSLISQRKQQ
jgi:hypothetical protein